MNVNDPPKKTRARAPASRDASAVLTRWAEWYLARFVVSEHRFCQALDRRCNRIEPAERPDAAFCQQLVDNAKARGLLDDARFAEGLALSLARKGLSRTAMRSRLQARGLARAVIDPVLPASGDASAECEQLRILCRRRGWAIDNPNIPVDVMNRNKQKALRAGFAWSTIQKVFSSCDD